MKAILIALLFVVSAFALTESEYRVAFDNFKSTYGKNYLQAEEAQRYNAFKHNLDFVNNWDAKTRGFTVAINKFADLTGQEFKSLYNGLNITKKTVPVVPVVQHTAGPQVQGDIVNWVNKGAVTGIKNQGQCGSCWSFSATGSMEGAHFLKTGSLVSLSEQNLVDCSTAQGNQGCNGGLMDQAFQYVIANKGIDTEASYQYTATGPNTCDFSASNVGTTISSYQDIPSGNEGALLTAANQQPVSVAIDASQNSFQLYSSGVYYEPNCSSTSLDHGVLVVGYGTDSTSQTPDYWLVKNSWGTDWGMNGYIEMARNQNNNCGIATAASYPII
jgi:cathepsin L